MRVLFSGPAVKFAMAAVWLIGFWGAYQALGRFAPVHFSTATEARLFFLSKGFYCQDGAKGSSEEWAFLVADHPLTCDDIAAIPYKSQCGMTPEWKGIVWVNQMNCPGCHTKIEPSTIGGKTRMWGNLFVAGDEKLMDLIEHCYHNR